MPALIDRGTGRVAVGVHTLLADLPFADVMAERLGMPVFVDNDGNCSALAEHRAGAAAGLHRRDRDDPRDRDRRRADPRRPALPRLRAAAPASSGTW